MSTKVFVLDTNVLLHDPYAIYKFQENQVIIPIVVVEEVDRFKRDQSETGRNARSFSRLLDKERTKGSLNKGVKLESGGKLQVVMETEQLPEIGAPTPSQRSDNWILGVALLLKNRNKRRRVILVSKDANLRIKADACGIPAEDFTNDKVPVNELSVDLRKVQLPGTALGQLQETGMLAYEVEGGYTNEFFLLQDKDHPEKTLTARYSREEKTLKKRRETPDPWGIKALNREQELALELLMDPTIKLVSLIGKAGTGKTLLAIAAGLHMVAEESLYNRLLVSRPVQPLGKDLGYLPGDVDEKMRPWMGPIFDNLDYILSCAGTIESYKGQPSYQYLLDKGWIAVEPLTYMRGRSIPNQYMIVDEAQNLTPHEIKSIITRVGHGTKFVLTGDPYQIDNPFLDSSTNGVSYVVKRLRGQSLFGHITLSKGERSELAELASNLL